MKDNMIPDDDQQPDFGTISEPPETAVEMEPAQTEVTEPANTDLFTQVREAYKEVAALYDQDGVTYPAECLASDNARILFQMLIEDVRFMPFWNPKMRIQLVLPTKLTADLSQEFLRKVYGDDVVGTDLYDDPEVLGSIQGLSRYVPGIDHLDDIKSGKGHPFLLPLISNQPYKDIGLVMAMHSGLGVYSLDDVDALTQLTRNDVPSYASIIKTCKSYDVMHVKAVIDKMESTLQMIKEKWP